MQENPLDYLVGITNDQSLSLPLPLGVEEPGAVAAAAAAAAAAAEGDQPPALAVNHLTTLSAAVSGHCMPA